MSGARDQIPEEIHVLAGEYVLGALDAAEMRAVRQQATLLPMLATAIEAWERRLAPMTRAVPPLPPPADLWASIEQALGPAPVAEPAVPFTVTPTRDAEPVRWPEERPAATQPAPEPAAPVPPPTTSAPTATPAAEPPLRDQVFREAPANDSAPREAPRRDTTLREPPLRDFPPRDPYRPELARLRPEKPPRAVWPWQVATAGALAFAAGVAAIVLVPALAQRAGLSLPGGRASPRVAAILPADSHANGFLAEARADGTVLLTAFAPVDVPAGKALELWLLAPGGTVPKSLGVLPAGGTKLVLPAMPGIGTALMVSLEPPGGSPTGAPTGPVLYAGKLQQI